MHNLARRRTEVAKNMDRQLRSIVDYDEVHGRWVRYCKSAFRQWRDQIKTHPVHLKEYGSDIPAASYEQIMANTYIGWNEDWARKIEDWLTE